VVVIGEKLIGHFGCAREAFQACGVFIIQELDSGTEALVSKELVDSKVCLIVLGPSPILYIFGKDCIYILDVAYHDLLRSLTRCSRELTC